jgi:hypothetical protein
MAQHLSPVANIFCGQDCEQAIQHHDKPLISNGKIVQLKKVAGCMPDWPVMFLTFFVDKIVSKDFAV